MNQTGETAPTGSPAPHDASRGGRGARIGLFLGPALGLLIALAPTPEGLERSGLMVAGLLALMAVWWASEAVPIAITSLLPLAIGGQRERRKPLAGSPFRINRFPKACLRHRSLGTPWSLEFHPAPGACSAHAPPAREKGDCCWFRRTLTSIRKTEAAIRSSGIMRSRNALTKDGSTKRSNFSR